MDVTDWLTNTINWIQTNKTELLTKISVGVIATLIITLFGLIIRKVSFPFPGILITLKLFFCRNNIIKKYKEIFTKNNLSVYHPWMKDEQNFKDLLVPIDFTVGDKTKREDLDIYITNLFRRQESPRLLIQGGPGSGKTIAMKVIAEKVFSIVRKKELIPVLITFSDLKNMLRDNKSLEQLIVERLEFYKFGQNKKSVRKLNNQTKNTIAQKFVEDNLYTGKIVLLFDGYDEVEKTARETTSNFLNTFLGKHEKIPAVFSSRTAVYEKEPVFNILNPNKISMAPFTRYAILRFLSHWRFDGEKSSLVLYNLINQRTHLLELATNPLTLTLITFIYSMTKYTLPDNRVEFYQLCTYALLEDWDRYQNNERINKYESDIKIAVLNRIAFEHLSTASNTDEAIQEDFIHRIIREVMRELSLKADEYGLLKRELIQNSGLLQIIPPTDYSFPHRTFMEFFAANYLIKQKNSKDVYELYKQDPSRWREVLLLYMGLNKKKDNADNILLNLINDFYNELRDLSEPDILVIKALTECAMDVPETAGKILDAVELFLQEKLNLEVIEELGFITASPKGLYAEKARKILLRLLKRLEVELDDKAFQQVIFSLLHAREDSIDEIILKNIKRFNLSQLFYNVGPRGKLFIHRLFSMKLSLNEKNEIINGLKESGNYEILSSILIEQSDLRIKEIVSMALFTMSKLDGFIEFLDNVEIGLLNKDIKEIINQKYLEWGWNWNLPNSESGKKIAILICYYAAKNIAKEYNNKLYYIKKIINQVNYRFRFLATGFLVEEKLPFYRFNLIDFSYSDFFEGIIFIRSSNLRKYWKNGSYTNNLWYKVLDTQLLEITGIISIALLAIFSVIGVMFFVLDFVHNKFYNYLYDIYSIEILWLNLIIYALNALIIIFKNYNKKINTYMIISSIIGIPLLLYEIHSPNDHSPNDH